MDVTKSRIEDNGEQVQAALENILRGRHFSQTPRLSAFLRLVVEKTVRGESEHIKEYLIGAEVYERDENYDPRVDSIVRVEASRLRARLRTYYETDGTEDALRIEMPKGSYVPVFRCVSIPAAEPLAAAPAAEVPADIPSWRVSRRAWLIGAGASAAAGAVFVALRNGVSASSLPVALLMTAERAPRGGWSAEAEDLSLHLEKSLAGTDGLAVLRSNNMAEMAAQAKAGGDASHYLFVLTGRCWEAPERLRVVMELRRSDTAEALWSRALDDASTRRTFLAEAVSRELRGAIRRFAANHRVAAKQKHALDLHAQARRILYHGRISCCKPATRSTRPGRSRSCSRPPVFSNAHAWKIRVSSPRTRDWRGCIGWPASTTAACTPSPGKLRRRR